MIFNVYLNECKYNDFGSYGCLKYYIDYFCFYLYLNCFRLFFNLVV